MSNLRPRLSTAVLLALALVAVMALGERPATSEPAPHPLDPLSRQEISAAGNAIRSDARYPEDGRFAQLSLQEPAKSAVLDWERSKKAVRREAFAVVYSGEKDQTWEVVVDLSRPDQPRIASWGLRPGVQPMMLDDELDAIAAQVREDPVWQEAVRKRNLVPADVALDVWAVGLAPSGPQPRPQSRLFRAIAFLQGDALNYYDRPIEGLEALVEAGSGKVTVNDYGAFPLPRESQDLDEESIRRAIGLREAPKPLRIEQPEGPSFQIDGQEVRWQKWRFRWQMHPREGLVIHQVRYEDKGEDGKTRERPVLYRGSISEMAVPYGDPAAGWSWRCAFDVGEYGIGKLSMPLTQGLDTPENAVLLDSWFANVEGRPRQWPRTVALYERDGGILWKHTSWEADDVRRSRELVLFSLSTVGNYDYGIFWIFKQDGTIEVEAGLTGIMLTKGVRDGAHDPHSHLVAPNVAAVHHQHILSFRLDLDVDGPVNSVYSMNSRPLENAPEPYNAFVMEERVFETELAARENMNMATARTWRVGNPGVRNGLGHETGYILIPGGNSLPLIGERSPQRSRGRFMDHHLWVTQYAPGEMYAAGDYPNQSTGEKGLPEWTKADRKVREQDVVLWYTMNVTHIPRPEEWPIMNVSRYGFKLVPAGFFVRNPALDVPLPK